jgi:hypothetical protein
LPRNKSKNKINYARNLEGCRYTPQDRTELIDYKLTENGKRKIIFSLPEEYGPCAKINSCVSINCGNIQIVICFIYGYSYCKIWIFYIKTNFKKSTGLDSLKTRKKIFSEKYNRLKKFINLPKFKMISTNLRKGDDYFGPNFVNKTSPMKSKQTVYYRFAIEYFNLCREN